MDLLGWVEPIGTYDQLKPRAEQMQVDGYEIWVISLDDLITIKRHISRAKDRAGLVQLEELKTLRDREGSGGSGVE